MIKKEQSNFFNALEQRISAYQFFQMLRFSSLLIPGIVLAQAAYSKEDIGLLEAFLMTASSISFFWVSALFSSLLSQHQKEENFLQYTWLLSLGCSVVAAFAVLVYFFLFRSPSFDPIYLVCLIVYLLTNNPAFSIENAMLLEKENKSLVTYGMLFFIVQMLCPIIIVSLHLPIQYLIFAIVLFSICRFLFSFFKLFSKGNFTYHQKTMIFLLMAAAPLALSYLMSGAAEYVDAFIVTKYFGKGAFGVYRYGAREFPVFLLLANTLSISMIPGIASNLTQGLSELKKRSSFLMHIAFPTMIVLVLCSKWIYPFVFNQAFAPAATYFNYYALLLICRLVFPQTILMALKQNKIVLISATIELFLNVSLSLVLLPSFGILGIIWATIIAYSVDKLFLIAYCKWRLKLDIKAFIPLKTLAGYSLVLLSVLGLIIFF
jgi:O-antigen/teichoic acid export membrane protein